MPRLQVCLHLLAAATLAVSLTACSSVISSPQTYAPLTTAALQGSRQRLFNADWKFILEDVKNGQDVALDDRAWRTLDLPHDWSIEGPFDQKWASATGYLPAGIGWYRKSFTLPADAAGKRLSVRFDGVYENASVYLNGHLLGTRPYGYSTFEYDLTPYLNTDGKPNLIAVRVDHSQIADSRWYTGSGIYRNVYLIVTSQAHVASNGVFAEWAADSAGSRQLQIATTLRNDDAREGRLTLRSVVRDPEGRTVARLDQSATLAAGATTTCRQSAPIPDPQLWSPDHPALYTLETRLLQDGKTVDTTVTPLGLRTIRFDANQGFFLNGQSLKMKGVCLHHDAGALGAAVPIDVWQRRLRILKEAGCNAIRTSHNPPAPEFLDLCDRMGFLVMDEAFDEWTRGKRKWTNGHNQGQFSTEGYWRHFNQWAERDLTDMVLRDRNHPSIVLWSIGNEIDYPNDPYVPNSPELPPIAQRLVKTVKAVDTSRPVTAACAAPATNLYLDLLDVTGYNYMERLYADHHAQNPHRIITGSENSQSVEAWLAVENNPYISAQFLWTGIDFIGESRPWPMRTSQAGMLDLAGFPKPQYYLRQSLWTDQPMVYLTPAFRGRGLSCYTNCDSVELFQNGKSLGELPRPANRVIVWANVQPNSDLKAVGKRLHNGASVAVATYELKPAGEAASLTLLPDKTTLSADDREVAQIEVNVTDAAGNLARNAAPEITCTLTGPARLLGIENGDPAGHENYQDAVHHAYRGRMLIYVQGRPEHGDIQLTVSAPNLKPAKVQLKAR